MSNNAPDYKDDLVFPPQNLKSQPSKWKSSDKLILTLMDNIKDKSDLLQQAMIKNAQLKELLKELKRYFDADGRYYVEKRILLKINQVLGEE